MISYRCFRPFQLGVLVFVGACQPVAASGDDQPPRATSPVAFPDASDSNAVTCSYPVESRDTIASLEARFGDDARVETLGGAEGSEFLGLAIWPDDPVRRLEVFSGEGGKQRVSFVRLGDKAEWEVAALKLGDPLARVREVNARPFTFWGLGWDYGGYVDLSGGRLKTLPGGCTLSLRFDALDGAEIPEEFVGDREVSSDNPRIGTLDARLVELGVGFPEG